LAHLGYSAVQSCAFRLALAADQRDCSHFDFFRERYHEQQLGVSFCGAQRSPEPGPVFCRPEDFLAAADFSLVQALDLVDLDHLEQVVVW
jgi:hypothetical protein